MTPWYHGVYKVNIKEKKMSKEELKKVSAEVSNECLKKLKITAIQKEITLGEYIREVLEKSVSKKVFEDMTAN